jgi:predicted ABC-class ATPase
VSDLEQKIRSMAKDGSYLCVLGGSCIDLNEIADRIVELERQNAELRKEKSMALGVMQELIDRIEVPEPNCSCHLSPPCGDCVDYGGIRETVDAAETLIAADQKGST